MTLEVYNEIAEKLGKTEDVIQTQMFGKKCLKFNGKAFVAFHNAEMVFKLGKHGSLYNHPIIPAFQTGTLLERTVLWKIG